MQNFCKVADVLCDVETGSKRRETPKETGRILSCPFIKWDFDA